MKKLFTTFLMMGFALASQATIVVTPSDDGKTLTISADAGDDFNQYYQDNIQNANPSPSWAGNVTKLVLTGKGFTNRDLAAEGRIPQLIEKCTGWTESNKKQLYLDLTGCENMVSKVVRASGYSSIDWENTNSYTFQPNPSNWQEGPAFTLQKINEKDMLSGISFPASDNFTLIPENVLNGKSIQTVVIPDNVLSIEKQAFQNCQNLTDVTFGSGLENIGEKAFEQAGISGTFEIPASVKVIKKDAFKECKDIVDIIIPAGSQLTHIYESAFLMENTSNLKNVYVNCDRYIVADKGAFGFQSTDGQTQAGTVTTRLHYPPRYYEQYVGAYKTEILGGLFEKQEQRLANRKYARAEGSVTGVDGNTYTNTSYPNGNGWWELLSTGIPVPYNPNWVANYNNYWRTYSDFVDLVVPKGFDEGSKFEESNEKGINVYLVNGINDEGKAQLVRMKVGDCIPAGTGVVIHWRTKVEDTSGGFIFFAPADSDNPGFGNPAYDNETNSTNLYRGTYKNYMKPLNTRGQAQRVNNVEKDESGNPLYRNFFWGNIDEYEQATNERYRGEEYKDAKKNMNPWGFIRCVSGDYTVNNKAFLHFPANVYSESQGSGIHEDHMTDTNNGVNAFGFVIVDGDENPTGINNATEPKVATDDSYYTLQGIKVTNPKESGIYIHNGKKVIIK